MLNNIIVRLEDMLNNIIVRLVAHYFASLLIIEALSLLQLMFDQTEESDAYSSMISMAFSFFFALPVSWVYRWTRPRKKYDQAFAQTLLVVPIAIALVVFLVKDSIALAFSLAGIVAAVQFRTSLEDPMDAVYMFIVIGIGLAAGIQQGVVAVLASVTFNIVILGVWRINWGAESAVLSGFREVHSGKEGSLTGVRAQAGKKPKPYNTKLRMHTTHIKAAQQAAVCLLPTYATRWEQVRTVKQKDGTAIVEFDVRLKKKTDPAAFTAALKKSNQVPNVELESMGNEQLG